MIQNNGGNTMSDNKFLMIDETHLILGGNDDNLKEKLRKIDNVPNASYLVKSHKVFVFDKLVAEVKKQQDQGSNDSLEDLALRLIPVSTISPEEAIESWGIMPEPYLLEKDNASGEFIIRHQPFNSIILLFLNNKKDANKALARLLMGAVIKGNGDFIYRGQSMSLRDPINTELLPFRPLICNIPESIDSNDFVYTRLSDYSFSEGFEPVSEKLFDDIKNLELSWAKQSNYASRYSSNHSELIWERVHEFPLETLNNPKDDVPDCAEAEEDLLKLRDFYPELSKLTDGSLYDRFDTYQSDCCYINGWSANRDDSFLFYLLGKLANNDCGSLDAGDIGEMMSYSLLNGGSFNDSLEFGDFWYQYDSSIKCLAYRVASAMQFLGKEREQTNLQGNKITTMMDVFRMGRKFNSGKPIEVTQTHTQFET